MKKIITVFLFAWGFIFRIAFAECPPAQLYFSFDNNWLNTGSSAVGEMPSRTGTAGGPTVRLSEGISGLAFDGRSFISCQPANVPVWGTDQAGLPDTEIEKLFEGARSFTVTAWIKTEALQSQGRLLKTPAFQITYRGDRLETGFAKPKKWFRSEISEERFGSIGTWRFVAVTWQSTGDGGVIHYYSGTENDPVSAAGVVITDWKILRGDDTGCWLTIGNSEADGNRPFVGLIDELRIWLSKEADKNPSSVDDIEAIRLRSAKPQQQD
jgi:hypothetical protein